MPVNLHRHLYYTMALINIETALRDAISLIGKARIDSGIEIMSYKRNRTVALIRLSEQRVLLREQGYVDDDTEVDLKQLPKKLKTVLKREFPRSRKVRFFKFTTVEELDRIHQKI